MTNRENKVHIPLFHITKRSDIPKWKAWLIRGIAVITALLVCGIVSAIITEGSFGAFFAQMFDGAFGSERRIWKLFQNIAMLLIVSLAVTPAFKMKFWNIGAEGQTLVGALMCTVCIMYLGGKVSNGGLIVIMLLASIVGGAIWALIPALFKAKWNTNETLFTLMMNYVATCLVGYCIMSWAKTGSATLGEFQFGHFPALGGKTYLLNIIIVAVLTAIVSIYLRYSKHGYEISVVGESMNTARYIGINTKKVIIRTMIVSGALCGIAGWLLVGGTNHTLTKVIVDGRGFTAILVSWLSQFNPLFMVLTSFLVIFLDQGAAQFSTIYELGEYFPDVITGIFFIFVIGCEFFINYKVKFRSFKKEVTEKC